MMHHAIASEEISKQNLHIWPNLMCFFRCWLFRTFPLGWFGVGFNVTAIHRLLVTSYDLFKQIWIVVEHRQHLLSDVNVTWLCFCLKFSNFATIFVGTRFMPKTSVKIAKHEPNDMPTSSAASQNHVLHCFIVFIGCWRARATRTKIVIGIFSAFLKLVIPQLNLCSACSRLTKCHSQHFKCPCTFNLIFYTKLNTVSLIHFFFFE